MGITKVFNVCARFLAEELYCRPFDTAALVTTINYDSTENTASPRPAPAHQGDTGTDIRRSPRGFCSGYASNHVRRAGHWSGRDSGQRAQANHRRGCERRKEPALYTDQPGLRAVWKKN